MKKAFLSLIVLLSSALALAEIPAGYTKVPDEQIDTYRRAVWSALNSNPSAVAVCNSNWVSETLRFMDEVLVNQGSAQPLLLLDTHYNGGNVMHRMVVTTDATLKNVTGVLAETYVMGEVNKGDLAHPVIVQDYVLQTRSNCTRQTQN